MKSLFSVVYIILSLLSPMLPQGISLGIIFILGGYISILFIASLLGKANRNIYQLCIALLLVIALICAVFSNNSELLRLTNIFVFLGVAPLVSAELFSAGSTSFPKTRSFGIVQLFLLIAISCLLISQLIQVFFPSIFTSFFEFYYPVDINLWSTEGSEGIFTRELRISGLARIPTFASLSAILIIFINLALKMYYRSSKRSLAKYQSALSRATYLISVLSILLSFSRIGIIVLFSVAFVDFSTLGGFRRVKLFEFRFMSSFIKYSPYILIVLNIIVLAVINDFSFQVKLTLLDDYIDYVHLNPIVLFFPWHANNFRLPIIDNDALFLYIAGVLPFLLILLYPLQWKKSTARKVEYYSSSPLWLYLLA